MNLTSTDLYRLARSQDAMAISAKASADQLRAMAQAMQLKESLEVFPEPYITQTELKLT